MKKNKFVWLMWGLVLGLFQINQEIQAQSFIRLNDATGLGVSQNILDAVEEASQNLTEEIYFGTGEAESFKVFDYGFYLHGESFSGSYPQAFEQARQAASIQIDQYLLIGRQIDPSNGDIRIWLDFNFETTDYSCLEKENIQAVLQNIVNNLLPEGRVENDAVFRIEEQLIQELSQRLQEGFCCSAYNGNVAGRRHELNNNRTANVCLDEEKIASALNFLKDNPEYAGILEKIRKIKEFYEECQSQDWVSEGKDGIIPKCIWENHFNLEPYPSLYYSPVDWPFYFGAIDGIYSEAKGLWDFLLSIDDIEKSLMNVFYSYTVYYLICEEGITITKTEFLEVMDELFEADWSNSQYKWMFDQVYNAYLSNREKAELIFSKLTGTNCADLEKMRNTIQKVYEAITSREAWVQMFKKLMDEAGKLWESINGFSDKERYYHGYYGVKVASLFMGNVFTKEKYLDDLTSYWDEVVEYVGGPGRTAYVRKLESELSAELLGRIKNKLPYKDWPPQIKNQFDLDFSGDFNTLKRIDEGGLGSAWKVAFKSQEVRTDPTKLSKLRQWLGNGLDETKLTKAFDDAPDGVLFYNKLDEAKSYYHQQVHIKDFDNIPGVQKTNYSSNGLSTGKSNPNWNNSELDLPVSEAANFTNVVATDLPAGTKIYRVTGGNPAGGYWTRQIPNDVGDVIGGTAVRPEWNSFKKFYEFEVLPGGLKLWEGGTARQRLTDGIDNYILPGGDPQIFIPQVLRDQNFANTVNEIPLPW